VIDVNYKALADTRFETHPVYHVFVVSNRKCESQTNLMMFGEADVAFDSLVYKYRKLDASDRDGVGITLARNDGVIIKHAYDLVPLGESNGVHV